MVWPMLCNRSSVRSIESAAFLLKDWIPSRQCRRTRRRRYCTILSSSTDSSVPVHSKQRRTKSVRRGRRETTAAQPRVPVGGYFLNFPKLPKASLNRDPLCNNRSRFLLLALGKMGFVAETGTSMVTRMWLFVGTTLLLCIRVVASMFAFVAASWLCAQMYTTYCAPPGLRGLFTSIFTTSSPMCDALHHMQKFSSDMTVMSCGSLALALAAARNGLPKLST